MLLMYILTFPAFSAHLEKGRGVLPPNMLLLLRKATATPFVWAFSVHVSSFASFQNIFAALQNNLCGGTGCYQGPPSKPYLVLASHGRKIRSFCACALSLWSLPSHSNEFVTRCSPFFWQFLKRSLEIYLVSKMKWKHCACLPNVYSK